MKKTKKHKKNSPTSDFHIVSALPHPFIQFFLKIGHFFVWCFHLILPDNFKEDPSFTDHVKLFFMTRYYSYLRKLFAVWVFVISTTLIVTAYNIYQTQELGAANATFPFDAPGSYTFDPTRVSITGSQATLLEVDQIDDDNTATGFSGGTFNNTEYTSSYIGLNATGLVNGIGTFTSRVIDAGGDVAWNLLNWTPERPIQKELPSNGNIESAYSTGNFSMSGNLLLMHLNETSGTIADSSGNNNTSTATGVTYATPGIFNTGIDLTGNGDKIESDAFTYNFTTQLTLAGWFRFSGPGNGSPRILEVSDLGNADSHALAPDGDGSLRAWAECDTGARVGSADDSTNYNDGQWHHFVYTYSNPIGRIYVDGTQTATASNACANLDDGNELILGAISDTSGSFTNAQHEFDGYIDEMAIFNRALSPSEIQQMYLRGALKQQIQVRTCDDIACGTEVFIGPDGTNATFFTEELNSSLSFPSFAMTLPNNRYFQYQVTFESDDNVTNPRFSDITIGPNHFDASSPTVQNTTGIAYTTSLDSFSETLGGGHTGTTTYQLSNNGVNYYYFNGSWSPAVSATQSNTAGIVDANISTFVNDIGSGSFFFRAFLNSNLGTQTIELDQIELTFDTGGGGGSGGGGASKIFYLPPVTPGNGFQVIVNNHEEQTSKQLVNLTFNAGNDIGLVELSNEQTMTDSIVLGISPMVEWDLCSISGKPITNECPDGEYTVYARFITAFGQPPSLIASDTIILAQNDETVTEINEELDTEEQIEEPEEDTLPPIEPILPSQQEDEETPLPPSLENTPLEENETTDDNLSEGNEKLQKDDDEDTDINEIKTVLPPTTSTPPPQPEPILPPAQEVVNEQIIQTVTQEAGTNNYLLTISTGKALDPKDKVFIQFLSGSMAGQSIVLDEYVANDEEMFFYTPLQVHPNPGDRVKVSSGTLFKQETFVSATQENQEPDFTLTLPETVSFFPIQLILCIGLLLGLFVLFSLWKQNTALTTLIEHEHANLYHKGKKHKTKK